MDTNTSYASETPPPQRIQSEGLKAVRLGGSIIRDHFGAAQAVTHKGKLDLVTETDHSSEEAIVECLNRAFPDHGILAEERDELNKGSPWRWIIDPLDGTTNFAHGYPFCCVSVAFESSGQVLWGAVYDPLHDELFTAQRGCGAAVNGKAITISATETLDRALLCTGFPYDVHTSVEDNMVYFERFIKTAGALRRDGAAALDLCYVAMGRFDGFWEFKLKPWDIAAGALIVAEAGGRVTNFSGNTSDLSQGEIVASNGFIHDAMVRILR